LCPATISKSRAPISMSSQRQSRGLALGFDWHLLSAPKTRSTLLSILGGAGAGRA
jgi:hypothetical protein